MKSNIVQFQLKNNTATHTSPTVLLVEDNEAISKVHSVLLTNWGLKVKLAMDGSQAISQFIESQIDLILLDIGLPDINGFQVSKIIRQQQRGKSLPIVALTTDSTVEQACYDAGMNHFILKPATDDKIKMMFNKFFPHQYATRIKLENNR